MARSGRRRASLHEVLGLFDALGQQGDFDLLDMDAPEKFMVELKRLLDMSRGQPHFKYGKRKGVALPLWIFQLQPSGPPSEK